MKQKHFTRKEMEPILQVLVLLGYAVSGGIVFGIIAIGIVFGLFGTEMLSDIMSGIPSDISADSFKILLFLSTSIGTFLIPALALAWTERIPVKKFYDFHKNEPITYLWVFLLMVVSLPIMEWAIELNKNMTLPMAFKDIEEWMRNAEDEAMRTTYTLLTIRNWWDLPANILVVAIAPGIAEEFIFRGGLQRSLGRMLKNPHFAIWATAIIFSAIHMQFFGFLPRMLLGAVFGYIYFWTKNLWFPIFAHFVNNGYAVLVAWNLNRQGLPLDQENMDGKMHWLAYIFSIIATVAILYHIKKQSDGKRAMDRDFQNG